VALYAFKAYFNGSWLFGFRFHLCHWKRWKGQLCDLSSLKVIPQADWLCQWLVGSRWIASSTWSGPQAPRCAEGYQVTVSDWTFYSPAPEVSVASQVEYKLDRIILCTYTYISYIMCIYTYIYIVVLEVYSGNTLCWRVGIRLICMKPHGFGQIHAGHKSFIEWCYT